MHDRLIIRRRDAMFRAIKAEPRRASPFARSRERLCRILAHAARALQIERTDSKVLPVYGG